MHGHPLRFAFKLLVSAYATFGALSLAIGQCLKPSSASALLQLLIVTGGHPYEPSEFFRLFDSMPNLHYDNVLFEDGKPAAGPPGGISFHYDVVLFYDMEDDSITPEWRSMLERGRGLIFLHHGIGSFPLSPEVKSIIGGHANFFGRKYPDVPQSDVPGIEKQHFRIVDSGHPITCGLTDFDMTEEVYDDVDVDPAVHVLVKSDSPKHSSAVTWVWSYAQKRVLYVQMGHGSYGLPMDHGPTAYENPSFKRLLTRGILWAAGRL